MTSGRDAGSRIGCGRPSPDYHDPLTALRRACCRSAAAALVLQMRSATYLPYERQGCRPPAARLIPVKAARAPQHDTVGIAIGRAELELPISGVDVLKLLRRSVVVLRPKVEKDRLAWIEQAVFRRFIRGARGPCPTIVVKGVR